MISTETEHTNSALERKTTQQFSRYSLDALAINLIRKQFPGYPAVSERLVLAQPLYDERGCVVLPSDGLWVAGQTLPTRAEQLDEILGLVGYPKHLTLDADWRPLHPWWRQMVTRPDIGGVVGRGFYYHWGPNYTADAAVIAKTPDGNEKILLIQRGDTGDWALPGGFVDGEELSRTTALRELQEESGMWLSSEIPAELLYSGPVVDIRTTLHAWAETSLWKFTLETDALPLVTGADDAIDARWFDIHEIPNELYGSHAVLIAEVLDASFRL